MILVLIAHFILEAVLAENIVYEHHIIVNGQNGTNDSSCFEGDPPCATINMALKRLRYNSTVILISPGNYILEHGSETNITGKHQIAIIGSGMNHTVIKCNPSTGLTVQSSSEVKIKSVNFHECGRDIVLSKQRFSSRFFVPDVYRFKAAVIFFSCSDVSLFDVTIQFSEGTGLLLRDVSGNLTIQSTKITDSQASSIDNDADPNVNYLVGGGIIFLFIDLLDNFDYCIRECEIFNNSFETKLSISNRVYDSCLNSAGGGINVIDYANISGYLMVDSCVLKNNTKGLFLHKIEGMNYVFKVKNSTIGSLNKEGSSIVNIGSGTSLSLQLLDVILKDSFTVNVDHSLSLNDLTIKTGSKAGYMLQLNSYKMVVGFSTPQRYFQLPVNFEKRRCKGNISASLKIRPGTCSNNGQGKPNSGLCPVPYSICFNDHDCTCYDNHNGTLCGQCKEGYSVAINSQYLSCVHCNTLKGIAIGWVALIGLEFIPITFMVAVIAILNIDLNQGSLNAYIFFCQMITISFPSVGYPAWIAINYGFVYRISNILFYPLSILNLNFVNFPAQHALSITHSADSASFPICISASTSPLGALCFWYVIAIYPLFLLALIYIILVLYDKGFRCAICAVRPVHRVMARFWRIFNIQPSLTHTVASIYTLCFTQLAATSLKILHGTNYEGKIVFFYDGTQPYFSDWHLGAGIFALFVLTLLIIPTLYLLLYRFRWFQHFIDKFKFRKDFLISVTDVFASPYKDGTNGTWDYRYLAGIHFALQLIIMLFYYTSHVLIVSILEFLLCSFCFGFVSIFRPFKRRIHNFNELFIWVILGVLSISGFFYFETVDFLIKPFGLIIGFIILFVIVPYCLVWIGRKCAIGYRYMWRAYKAIGATQHNSDDQDQSLTDYARFSDSLYADRLMNPNRYDS